MQKSLYFGLHFSQVGILSHAEPSGIVAYAVETLALIGSPTTRNVGDDLARHEVRILKIGIHALDGAFRFIHLDDAAHQTLTVLGYPAGQRLADENIGLTYKILYISFYDLVLWKHLEECRVGLHTCSSDQVFTYQDGRLPQQGHVRHCLYLGDVYLQFFLVPISKAQELITAHHEGAFPLWRLVCHLILLHHIAAYEDDEG